jgi:hypothetical protein
MSGPLNDTPVGTNNPYIQVINTYIPAGERPNKTPISISGVSDIRALLV